MAGLVKNCPKEILLRKPDKVGLIMARRDVLEGSWDLVTRVIIKVTILIITYNPNSGTYNLTY